MLIKKRNGNLQEFDQNKIKNAINKAFNEVCGRDLDELTLSKMIEEIIIEDGIDVEDIQNKVERVLMEWNFFDVAKAYIIYREKRKELRFIEERSNYIDKCSQSSSNTATLSEVDSNANVQNKNVATVEAEVYKVLNKDIQRYKMKKKLQELYPEVAEQYEKDLNSHIIYVHDESSSPIVKPYTYSSKEVVEVYYNSKSLLLPLDLLWKLVDEPEICVDQDEVVFQKYPWNLFIKDGENSEYTKVTVLTKKKRHRPLVRVKTAFGEDLVVTDNHPLIIDKDNINNTISASESLNHKQYRVNSKIKFKGKTEIDLVDILPTWIIPNDKYIKYQQTFVKRRIALNRDFGYIVGFFIGDGGYVNTNRSLTISQKDRSVLVDINNKLYDIFGIGASLIKNDEKYVLNINNFYIYELFKGYFKIQDKAQNKTLPYNILEFNTEFALGCLEGLIDSDGTIKKDDCQINIRLSSRACILQCTYLFRHFGYSIGNTIQSLPFSNNELYHTNYTIWGINATKRSDSVELNGSFKCRTNLVDSKVKSFKYKSSGYCNITSVDYIEEESSFLLQNEYIYDLTTETHTFNSNNILVHNCVAVSLYPFFREGTSNLDGLYTKAPTNLTSFCGQFNNLVFLLSSQFKGAIAFGEFFNAIYYYCVKEWGEEFWKHDDDVANCASLKPKTIKDLILQAFQNIVYSVNQPAGNRSFQSPFTNISYYDSNYWKSLFSDFYFPDGTQPIWEGVDYLQRLFINWFNEERSKTLLTFPVETMALLSDGKDIIDKSYKELCSKMYSKGHSFFTYISDNAEALSSCCRLRSEIEKNEFSFTNGLTGVATGSVNVITLNLNRIIQNCVRDEYLNNNRSQWTDSDVLILKDYLTTILERVYKYHKTFKTLLIELFENEMLPVYSAGYIDLKQQFNTIGINGINEAAEFLGIKCSDNSEYEGFCAIITSTISEQNKLHKEKWIKFNQEFVPAENLALKNYKWDKRDGYWVPNNRNCYNSYFYKPDDNSISILERFRLQGNRFAGLMDGGVALHCNLEEHLTQEQYIKLINYAIENGTSYFTFNIPNSQCNNCGFISKHKVNKCPKCSSDKITWWTRIIGYLRPITSFSEGRQEEASKRIYL